jgi:hypothetical protein
MRGAAGIGEGRGEEILPGLLISFFKAAADSDRLASKLL